MRTIGFIGLGAMGLPMAKNLLERGFTVQGFDVRPDALAVLEQAGGLRAASSAEAATGAEALILMVVDAAQAEAILFDERALAALPGDGIVALMATCPPGAVEAIAVRVLSARRRFIDCPVSGGVLGARSASLTIMAAASQETFESAKPVLDALGDKVFHVGEQAGQGAMVKTVNQLLCGVHIAVVAEALSLAAKVNVNLEILLRIISGSSASSWMLKERGPLMLQAKPEVMSPVDIFVKDLSIVLEAGRDAKAALPIAAVAQQMFLAASGRGEGAADASQVISAYFAMNGTDRPAE
jgi:L-threonate 2-dehydrogenase